ncbi:DUF417 family protein [uncultured Akkermansia sp.]|uniref:DUF417 family protein n=1 Tax=uncultured Akkermansia sp. TaxID=512294 RepID=UPI00265CF3D0|nr:DUF417 family protein [uncultured Akkermansia sp.]
MNIKLLKKNTIATFPPLANIGYYISLIGIVVIMLWIGFFKFTPTEAAGIRPYVENHFLLYWLYNILNVQQVSDLFGIIEIITGLLLLISLKYDKIRPVASLCLVVTFLITLSFLLTTPGLWKIVDGMPSTDFFILKDIPLLGLGLMYLVPSPYKTPRT